MTWLVLKKSIKSTQIRIKLLFNIPPEVDSRVRQRFLGGSESEKRKIDQGKHFVWRVTN